MKRQDAERLEQAVQALSHSKYWSFIGWLSSGMDGDLWDYLKPYRAPKEGNASLNGRARFALWVHHANQGGPQWYYPNGVPDVPPMPADWMPDPEEAAKCKPFQLLRTPNFGRGSLAKVAEWLAANGHPNWLNANSHPNWLNGTISTRAAAARARTAVAKAAALANVITGNGNNS